MTESTSHFQQKMDALREALGFDFASLAFANSAADGFVITWQYASGNLNTRYKRIALQIGKGIAGIVMKTGKPMLVSDVQTMLTPENLINYPIVRSEKLTSLVAVPLFQHERVSGVLLAGFRGERRMTEPLYNELMRYLDGTFGSFEVKELTLS